jgi:hypothetical protein
MPVQACEVNGNPGWSFGPSGKCYTYEEGNETASGEAKKKAYLQGVAMGEGDKQADASGELSYEYLLAFYQQVKNHPGIFDGFKGDIHLTSRGIAGGQLKGSKSKAELIELPGLVEMPKLANSAPIGGKIVYEDSEMIEIPVVVMKEGLFTGTNGIPQQKLYEEFVDSAQKRLNGVPILPYHVPGMVTADDRWLGHLKDVRVRPDKKDVAATARFYKNVLSPDELARIKSLEPFDGSIGYTCKIDNSTGQVIERGPYQFTEFAIVDKGACSKDHGCGFFKNEAAPEPVIVGTKDEDDKVGNVENVVIEKIESEIEGLKPELDADYAKLIEDAFAPINARLTKLFESRKIKQES